MIRQLVFTSAPNGLRPGTQGFTTVAASRDLPPPLISRLEALSAYRRAYDLASADDQRNPVCLRHVIVRVGDRRHHVLSRIAPAPADYTGRSNHLAHHLVLDESDLPEAGPAAVLAQPWLFFERWEGEPRYLDEPVALSVRDAGPRPCRAWGQAAGDPGWAGELPRRLLEGRGEPVYLIHPPETAVLPLLAEAIALLPPAHRWRVTFSTWYTGELPGTECAWRGVLAETEAASDARSDNRAAVIDLTQPRTTLGVLKEDRYTEAARAGEAVEPPSPTAPARPPSARSRTDDPDELELADTPTSRPPSLTALPPAMPTARPWWKRRATHYTAAAVALLALLIGGGVWWFLTQTGNQDSVGEKVAATQPKTKKTENGTSDSTQPNMTTTQQADFEKRSSANTSNGQSKEPTSPANSDKSKPDASTNGNEPNTTSAKTDPSETSDPATQPKSHDSTSSESTTQTSQATNKNPTKEEAKAGTQPSKHKADKARLIPIATLTKITKEYEDLREDFVDTNAVTLHSDKAVAINLTAKKSDTLQVFETPEYIIEVDSSGRADIHTQSLEADPISSRIGTVTLLRNEKTNEVSAEWATGKAATQKGLARLRLWIYNTRSKQYRLIHLAQALQSDEQIALANQSDKRFQSQPFKRTTNKLRFSDNPDKDAEDAISVQWEDHEAYAQVKEHQERLILTVVSNEVERKLQKLDDLENLVADRKKATEITKKDSALLRRLEALRAADDLNEQKELLKKDLESWEKALDDRKLAIKGKTKAVEEFRTIVNKLVENRLGALEFLDEYGACVRRITFRWPKNEDINNKGDN